MQDRGCRGSNRKVLFHGSWSLIFFCCPSVFNDCISIHEWPVRCTVTVRLLRTDGACCGTGAHLKVRTWNCSVDCLSRFPVCFFFHCCPFLYVPCRLVMDALPFFPALFSYSNEMS